ncbi:MAG: hypothetical protein AABW81_00545 [Nanoarchaeota archaeon]
MVETYFSKEELSKDTLEEIIRKINVKMWPVKDKEAIKKVGEIYLYEIQREANIRENELIFLKKRGLEKYTQ